VNYHRSLIRFTCEKKSDSSHTPNSIHVWRDKWIIRETEPDLRVKRKVNHRRNRTKFTCEKEVNHCRNWTPFTCEESESSQKPNSIYVWKEEWIVTLNWTRFTCEKVNDHRNPIHVWRDKWIITETEPESRVNRKMIHHRHRTRFTCEQKNESLQKPIQIHLWKEKWIIT